MHFNFVGQVRRRPFFLSQPGGRFDPACGHPGSAMQGFLRGWHRDVAKPVVADKGRTRLYVVKTLRALAPQATRGRP